MSIRNLDKIFEPHRVAVIGASDTPTSVGYTVLRNLVGSGFRGVVYPVNAKREAVQGIQAYKDIPSLPHAPDLAVICTPAPTRPGAGAAVRRGGHAGGGHHLGRVPRNRRGRQEAGGASPPGAAEVRRHADFGSELPGDHRAGHQPERQFCRRLARQGTHRLHLAIRGAVHVGARLGVGRRASGSRISFPWATCST